MSERVATKAQPRSEASEGGGASLVCAERRARPGAGADGRARHGEGEHQNKQTVNYLTTTVNLRGWEPREFT